MDIEKLCIFYKYFMYIKFVNEHFLFSSRLECSLLLTRRGRLQTLLIANVFHRQDSTEEDEIKRN